MNYNLIAYAQDFVSFLLQNIRQSDKIDTIILFGSVVRGETDKNSDVDIFIETRTNMEDEIEKLKMKFYNSIKVRKYWDLLGVKNEIHCEVGNLDEWQDLEKSLNAQGIILFGKYKSKKQGSPCYLFSIEQGKNRNKNISLWRTLYGYKQKVNNKIYEKRGFVEDYNGEKIARGVFIIPSEHAQKIISFLKNNKIRYKIILFWKDN
ncbi:MAG: nucleotidyltransferase domain-containing protein [Nanoarchaeota archaeon]